MKYLVVYAHPNPKSFNHAVKEAVVAKLKKEGHSVEVHDLYAMDFNPVLKGEDFVLMKEGKAAGDVSREQASIRSADMVVFIHPIWWFNMPAILKGWIDRCFSHGFAYKMTENGVEGLFKDKGVVIFNTTGGTEENYKSSGYIEAVKKTIEKGTLEFCGMKVRAHKFFHAVPFISEKERSGMLEQIKSMQI